jgi:hypothetical protein
MLKQHSGSLTCCVQHSDAHKEKSYMLYVTRSYMLHLKQQTVFTLTGEVI